ncbi:MAG: hypothetical protein OCD02_11290 [Spirochaetaceae bacterium]
MQKVCIIDNESDFPAFRVREYFDSLNLDCFISNSSRNGNIDIKLFVSDEDEILARSLLETADFIKVKDGCPMCGKAKYKTGSSIIHKFFNLKKKHNNYCRYCKFKW